MKIDYHHHILVGYDEINKYISSINNIHNVSSI